MADTKTAERELLAYALQSFPTDIAVTDMRVLVTDLARQNDDRPAFAKVNLPDDAVKALKGPRDRAKTTCLVVLIPQAIVDRQKSRLVLPAGSTIRQKESKR